MPLTKITTHGADAVSRLIEQYRDKPGMQALVRAFASRVQVTENSLWDLFTLRDIDSATADALDQLGAIVGQARQSADDTTYRLYVRTRIRINRSSGTAADLFEVLGQALPPGTHYELRDRYPAAFTLRIIGATTADLVVILARFVREARAAGVGAKLLWQPETDTATFRFSDPAFPFGRVNGFTANGSVNLGVRKVYGAWPIDPFTSDFAVLVDPSGPNEELCLVNGTSGTPVDVFTIDGGTNLDHDDAEILQLFFPFIAEDAGGGFAHDIMTPAASDGRFAGVIDV